MAKPKIGIIGGTGLYNLEGFTNQKWVKIKTPFGIPSDDLLTGKLAGRDVVFLSRHGRGHRILPKKLQIPSSNIRRSSKFQHPNQIAGREY